MEPEETINIKLFFGPSLRASRSIGDADSIIESFKSHYGNRLTKYTDLASDVAVESSLNSNENEIGILYRLILTFSEKHAILIMLENPRDLIRTDRPIV